MSRKYKFGEKTGAYFISFATVFWSLKVFEQKLNYLHNNPVESGFVLNPIDWKFSSAKNYGDDTVLEIDVN